MADMICHKVYELLMSILKRFRALIKVIISHVRLFMIISHVKIIAFQISLFCTIYNKQKNTWVRGNNRFISRVEHDISLVRCAHS